MLVACASSAAPLAIGICGALFTTVFAIFAKSFISKWTHPAPPAGRTILLTFAEPLVYSSLAIGTLGVADAIGVGLPLALYPLVGLAVAFVTIAGFHGRFLGHARPDLPESRRFFLSLLYSLVVPATVLLMTAAVTVVMVL